MFCPKCGAQIEQDSIFCAKCGNKIPSRQPAPAGPPFQSSKAAVAPTAQQPATPVSPSMPDFRSSVSQLTHLKRPTVVSVLAILNYIAGSVFFLSSVFVLIFGSKESASFAGSVGISISSFLLAVLYVVCGHGLWTLKPYGRTTQIVLAFFGLFAFPIGTVISIVILFYFYKQEVKVLFSGKEPMQLTPAEANMLMRFAGSEASTSAVIAWVVAASLVVLFIGGIIAAIAIPNLLNAIQRGKQKRTIADIRAIATACEAYAVDNNAYPQADTIEELAPFLEPKYIKTLPRRDGWENPIYYKWNRGLTGMEEYIIVSAGKEGVLENPTLQGYVTKTTDTFESDIVFSNGVFIQAPRGSQ